MTRLLATLCTLVAFSLPAPALAIAGQGYCVEKAPVTVTVKEGDILGEIAKDHYDGDWKLYQDIAEHNGITNPDLIHPGQVIKIPGKTYERVRLVSATDGQSAGKYCTIIDSF